MFIYKLTTLLPIAPAPQAHYPLSSLPADMSQCLDPSEATAAPRTPFPALRNAAVAAIIADGVAHETPRETSRQITLAPVVIDVEPNPKYNMEQVTSTSKKKMTGDFNLQKPLFKIDTTEITGEQASKFQNQANQWHENFLVHQVVVDPATSMLYNTLLLATQSSLRYLQANMQHGTIKLQSNRLPKIITKYFADKNDIDIMENFSRIGFHSVTPTQTLRESPFWFSRR